MLKNQFPTKNLKIQIPTLFGRLFRSGYAGHDFRGDHFFDGGEGGSFGWGVFFMILGFLVKINENLF